MTSAPTTPLRQRMIEDMTIRQFGSKTQHDYVRVVADFARFLGCSPDQAEPEDLRRYQLHLAADGASPSPVRPQPARTVIRSSRGDPRSACVRTRAPSGSARGIAITGVRRRRGGLTG